MKEIKSIINAFDNAVVAGKRSALATVVHVEGSSYRRPGARMLIAEDGELTGSISGGCLEGDALRKAQLVIMEDKPMLVTYDTSDEDDAKLGMGLGCNGIIQVLIEPLNGKNGNQLIQLLRWATANRQKSSLVSLFSLTDKKATQQGTCLLLTENGEIFGGAPLLNKLLLEEARKVLENQKSTFKNYDTGNQQIVAFTEIVLPPVSLVIIGAGNDTFPLVEMADTLGWQTTVIDGRPNYASKERFPFPSCSVFVSKPENVLQQIVIDERTVFVLMTHNYNYDLAMLRALLDKNIIYIGILGPRKKMEMMREELSSEGIELTHKHQAVIHGPVGLNIGAETAAEIALSVLAEIKAVLSSRQPAPLRGNEGTIHERSDFEIEEVRIEPSMSKNK